MNYQSLSRCILHWTIILIIGFLEVTIIDLFKLMTTRDPRVVIFYLVDMKAVIKIASAGKFTPDQEQIIKRVALVLIEHNLSIKVQKKIKVTQSIKLKVSWRNPKGNV